MNSQRTTDPGALVRQIRQGNAAAWNQLVERYEPLLAWSARQYRLSGEDAADAVQTTWLRCLEHFDQLADADRFVPWVMMICRRECIRLATFRRREVLMPDILEPTGPLFRSDGEDPCTAATRRDERERLHRAIARLPQQQRVVVQEFMDRDGESYLEASRRLGVPVGSIGPTRQRALVRLRQDPWLSEGEPAASADVGRQLQPA